VLRRELSDVDKTLATIVGKDARTLDDELKRHKLAPLPALTMLDADDELDELAFHCVASGGKSCAEEPAAALRERD